MLSQLAQIILARWQRLTSQAVEVAHRLFDMLRRRLEGTGWLKLQLFCVTFLLFYCRVSDALLAFRWRRKERPCAFLGTACVALTAVATSCFHFAKDRRWDMAAMSVAEINASVLAWRSLQQGYVLEELTQVIDLHSIFEALPQVFLQTFLLTTKVVFQGECARIFSQLFEDELDLRCATVVDSGDRCCKKDIARTVFNSTDWTESSCSKTDVIRLFEGEGECGGNCYRSGVDFSFLEGTSLCANLALLTYAFTERTRLQYPSISRSQLTRYYVGDLLTHTLPFAMLLAVAWLLGNAGTSTRLAAFVVVVLPLTGLNCAVSLWFRDSCRQSEAALAGTLTSFISPLVPMPAMCAKVPRRRLLIARMAQLHSSAAALCLAAAVTGFGGMQYAFLMAAGAFAYLASVALAHGQGLFQPQRGQQGSLPFLLSQSCLMAIGVIGSIGAANSGGALGGFVPFVMGYGPLMVQNKAGMAIVTVQESSDSEAQTLGSASLPCLDPPDGCPGEIELACLGAQPPTA